MDKPYYTIADIAARYDVSESAAYTYMREIKNACGGGAFGVSRKVMRSELEYWESLDYVRDKLMGPTSPVIRELTDNNRLRAYGEDLRSVAKMAAWEAVKKYVELQELRDGD